MAAAGSGSIVMSMRSTPKRETDGTMKSISYAFLILVLHLILIAGIGILVLFFKVVVSNLLWIFLGGSTVLIISCWLLYRRMKREGKSLKQVLSLPVFRGKAVEVSFFGGIATLKVENSDPMTAIDTATVDPSRQLEDPGAISIKELNELVRLFENDLITLDEYNKAKQILFKS